MSAAGDAFTAAFGAPDPATPNGVRFSGFFTQEAWEELNAEIGSGWFMNGFLYLFGDQLESLRPCLDAWSFVVPPNPNRLILGRTAYGAIFVLDNPGAKDERVCIVDPFTVTYWSDPNSVFGNLIGRSLPEREFPDHILDAKPYEAWRKANEVGRLEFDDVLGIKTPRPLGGKLDPDNFQLESIIDYYQTTAPIYAKAFATLNKR